MLASGRMMALPPLPEILRIFPHNLAKERALSEQGGACQAADALVTFDELFRLLAAQNSGCYAPALLGRLLVRELLHARAAGALVRGEGRLGAWAHDSWGVRAVHRALLELRLAGVAAARLNGPRLGDELRELGALLEDFENILAAANLVDDADQQRNAILAVVQGELPPRLAAARQVVVEGGALLFGARFDVLRAFAARGMAVRVRLPWDAARPQAFAWPEASLHSMEARGVPDALHVEYDARVGEGPLAAVRAAHFAAPAATPAGTLAAKPTAAQAPAVVPVKLLQCPATPEHARAVAATVAQWLHAGVGSDAIAVVVVDVDGLGAQIAESLEALGVAAYLGRGPPLERQPVAAAVLLALRLPQLGYPREALIDLWLALEQSVATPVGPLAPDAAAALLRRAGVRSARVGGLRETLLAHAQQAPASAASGGREAQVAVAAALAGAVEALIGKLEAVPAQGPLAAFGPAVLRLIADLGFKPVAVETAPDDPDGALGQRRRLWRAQARQAAALEFMQESLLDLEHAALLAEGALAKSGGAAHAWQRDEVADLLSLLFSEQRLAPAGMRAGAVMILAPEDVVEARFSRLIFAGMDAGSFPRGPAADAVLTESLRGEVNRLLGPRLLQAAAMEGRGALQADARDTWLWLEVLAACQDELVVTFTTADGEDDRGRSDFVEEVLRAAGLSGPQVVAPSYGAAEPQGLQQVLERWSSQSLARLTAASDAAAVGGALLLGRALHEAFPQTHARVQRLITQEQARQHGVGAEALSAPDRAALAQLFFGQVHSVSSLDTLGMCAYRHFAGYVLKLGRNQVPTLGADAREEGQAAHAALHRIYRDIVQRGGLREAALQGEAARQRAWQVFQAHEAEILAEVVVHPLLRRAVLEQTWALVATQLAFDFRLETAAEPVALEYRFDDRAGAPASVLRVPCLRGERELLVRGTIDRVDVEAEAPGQAAWVWALDYKRSKPQRQAARHFQLPIYAEVAWRDFGGERCRRYAPQGVRAAWIELRSGKRLAPPEAWPPEPSAWSAAWRGALYERIDRTLSGNISPDPESKAVCERCDFAALCRFVASGEMDADAALDDA